MGLEILILIFLLSLVVNGLILILSKIGFLNDTDRRKKSHAIHTGEVPRVGGLSIFLSFFMVFLFRVSHFWGIFFVSFMVFLVGFIEDIKKNISPKLRLLILFLISILAIILINIKIHTIGFGKIPSIVSFLLTIIAIAGFTNAINIIDGLNGLAAGISATFLLFLGISFYEYNYFDLYFLSFSVIVGILGFLLFNFPYGKLFLGDGGAYFLGFLCAILSIKLVDEVPTISPWFPFMLGIYPVWEVIFSAYRRLRKNRHPFYPDKLHFHTLLFYRFANSNPKASFLILIGNFVFSLIAFLLKSCTTCLVLEFFLFITVYFIIYRWLTRISFANSLEGYDGRINR